MNRIRVIYHDEPPYGWWAESPDIDGWTPSLARTTRSASSPRRACASRSSATT